MDRRRDQQVKAIADALRAYQTNLHSRIRNLRDLPAFTAQTDAFSISHPHFISADWILRERNKIISALARNARLLENVHYKLVVTGRKNRDSRMLSGGLRKPPKEHLTLTLTLTDPTLADPVFREFGKPTPISEEEQRRKKYIREVLGR
ncbi:MAG: hypothetical protein ABIG96_03390 [Candidatus Micrarchaeota archaeon]